MCTTAKNPQSNAMCKRMHQTVGYALRTLLHGEPPQDMASAKEYIDEALSIAMHAMRAAIHSTLGSSPGSLALNWDMFLNISLFADWHTIAQRQEHLINENLIRQKNQWTIRSSTDTCKWYSHNRVKTRHLSETQCKKGYILQRAHST
jgi:hypothetical protein